MEFYAHSIDGKIGIGLSKTRREEHEGTVPDLRTERSEVVESGLSPALHPLRLNSDAVNGDDWRGCGMEGDHDRIFCAFRE